MSERLATLGPTVAASANINGPIFFCNTVEHYLFIQELFLNAPAYFSQVRPGAHRFFTESNGSPHAGADARLGAATGLALKIFDIPGPTLLEDEPDSGTFDYAKVRITPDPSFASAVVRRTIDPASAQEVFRPALQAELQERPYAFDIQVQLCTDLERMPVEDTTVEGPEQLSPSVIVAKLRLPQRRRGTRPGPMKPAVTAVRRA
ncbi:catalase family protein [Streptomyces mirabilis]|uniref:hypothetical protein n=1 Tax=Streptomyces mirabilis TaxID=68239 RepID=UPI0036DE1F43